MRQFSPLSLFSVVFALLLAGTGGVCQTAMAQQPGFDADQPIQSLKQAGVTATSDSQLVALATALQSARADTDISFHEYKRGVLYFQQNHPGFYGNFFGDPVYATYDIAYQKLTRMRQVAEPTINPQNSIRSRTWFFCSPFLYDPAFGGHCRGLRFAASDFFFLPSGPAFALGRSNYELDRRLRERTRRVHNRQRRLPDATSSEPDTSGGRISSAPVRKYPDGARLASTATGTADPVKSEKAKPEKINPEGESKPISTADESEAPDEEKPERVHPELESKPISTMDEIEVPDRVSSRMQERASVLRRKEIKTRVRYEIKRQYGDPENLAPRERARLANRLAERDDSQDERANESPPALEGTGRIDQSEIRDRVRRLDRPENRVHSSSRSDRTSPRERQRPNPESDEHRPAEDDHGEPRTTNVDPPTTDTPSPPTPNRDEFDRSDDGNASDRHN